jgi:hypothetical protein
MEQIREPWETDCDNIIDLFRPDLNRFASKGTDTRRKILAPHIHEGTGPWAARLMSDGIQGNLVSQSLDWIRYLVEETWLKGNDDINKWLQELEEHMLWVYRKSNFYDALGPYCRGAITVGSPVMIPELDDTTGRIKCFVPHPAIRYLMQNRFGETDVLHLKDEWTIRNAVEKFGKENMSQGVQRKYDNGDDNEKVTIIRGIYFYLDRIFKELPEQELDVVETYDTEGKGVERRTKDFNPRWPWVSIYVEKDIEGNDRGEKKPLKIEGYWSKPFSVWHYEKDQGEVYARTPAWMSYYDVQSANQTRKSLIMAGQRSVERAWWVPDFLKTQFKTYPRGMNWFAPGQQAYKPEPLDDNSHYPFGADIEDRFIKSVERWFHVRMWMMLSIWSEEQKAPPTATQIIQMAGEKAVLLGPRVGRFMHTLEENDARFIDIEDRRGTLPIKPDILLEQSDGEINPEFVGPLAQLQKQFHSSRNIEGALAASAMVFEIDPLTRYKIKAEKLVEHILELNKFPQDLIRDEDEYEDYVKAIAEQAQAERTLEAGGQIADAVPKLQKKTEEGSPLELITGAA